MFTNQHCQNQLMETEGNTIMLYVSVRNPLPESKSSFLEALASPRPSMSTSLSGAFRALNVTSVRQNSGLIYMYVLHKTGYITSFHVCFTQFSIFWFVMSSLTIIVKACFELRLETRLQFYYRLDNYYKY